jgi:hypothetical protein
MRRVGLTTDARRGVPQRVTSGPARQKRTARRGEACRRWLRAEAARRAEMAARMDLDPVSQTPGPWPGPVIASSAPAGPASGETAASGPRGHPVTPKRRPCSARPGTRGQRPGQRPDTRPSARRTGRGRSSRPARVTGYARWPGTAAPAGRAGAGLGLLSKSASACRCAGVSGGAAWARSLIQTSRPLPKWGAGCSLWS